jgi:hypothetical protein
MRFAGILQLWGTEIEVATEARPKEKPRRSGACNAAVAFAKANGCTISTRLNDNLVCFVKPAK